MSEWDELLQQADILKDKEIYKKKEQIKKEQMSLDERYKNIKKQFDEVVDVDELSKMIQLYEKLLGGANRFRKPNEEDNVWWQNCTTGYKDREYFEKLNGIDWNNDRLGIGYCNKSHRNVAKLIMNDERLREFDDHQRDWYYLEVDMQPEENGKFSFYYDAYVRHQKSRFHSPFEAFLKLDPKERKIIVYEHMIKAYPKFVENFRQAVQQEMSSRQQNVENIVLPDVKEKTFMDDFSLYCTTDSTDYYMSDDGEKLYAVDRTLTDSEMELLLKNAIDNNVTDSNSKVYLFADSNELHENLEKLFESEKEDEICTFKSTEFENGYEQFIEETEEKGMEI